MKIRTIVILTLVMIMISAFTFSLYANAQKYGGTLNYGLLDEPKTLSTFTAQNVVETVIISQIFEPLVHVNREDGSPDARLAKSWDISEDGKTYTFYLHENVKFHDGQQMTADDVKYSFDMANDPKYPRKQIALEFVTSIEVVDDYTLRIHMDRADSVFLNNLFNIDVVPSGSDEDTRIGTGPFKFVSWEEHENVVLERNEEYWIENLPYLDRVVYQMIPDEDVRIMRLKRGELDFIQSIAPEKRSELDDDPNIDLHRPNPAYSPPVQLAFIRLTDHPLNDVKVRQAISYAIDREAIKRASFDELDVVATSMPPDHSFYNPGQREYIPRDVDKAKELLQESSYDGETLRMEYFNDLGRTQALVMQNSLREVGINISLNRINIPQLSTKLFESGDYDIIIAGTNPLPNPHDLLVHPFLKMHGVAMGTDTEIPELYDLASEARSIADEEEFKMKLYELQELIAEMQPGLVIGGQRLAAAATVDLKNFVADPLMRHTFLTEVWLDR